MDRVHGAICGHIYRDTVVLNIEDGYYLKNTCNAAVANKEDSQYDINQLESITNEELMNYLNSYIEKENPLDWKKWKLGEDGYPIFA